MSALTQRPASAASPRLPPPPPGRWRANTRVACERLAINGLTPRIQGTTVHDRMDAVVAGYATIGTLLAAATWLWPLAALTLLLLVAVSARVDLDGGRGLVRSLIPREIGYDVVGWPSERLAGAMAPNRPMLLVVAPLEGDRPPGHLPPWLVAPTVGLLLVIAGVADAIALSGADSSSLRPLGIALLIATAVIAGGRAARTRTIGELGPPADAVLDLAGRLREHPPEHLAVAIALIGGGPNVADGLATLLLNQRHLVPPEGCRVLVVASSAGRPRALQREGRLLRRAADPLLTAAARAAGLAPAGGSSGAGQAIDLGWRALGVAGVASAARVEQVVHALDVAVRDGRW